MTIKIFKKLPELIEKLRNLYINRRNTLILGTSSFIFAKAGITSKKRKPANERCR
jgi:heme/copper-type cytochrome/quinol oxidase subunit 3